MSAASGDAEVLVFVLCGFEWVSGELGKLLVGTSITYAYQYNALNAAVRHHPNPRQTTLHVKNIHVPTPSSWPRCNEPPV